jgi:tetratricopeptide (TPR) repeat protein
MRISAWCVLLLAIGSRGIAQAPKPSPDRLPAILTAARNFEAAGNYEPAVTSYLEALQLAAGVGSRERQAEISLKVAHVLQLQAASQNNAEGLLRDATKSLQEAIRLGNPSQRFEASNNLGVLLLQMHDPSAAQQVLAAADAASIPAESRHVYFYNCGQASEANSDWAGALSFYGKSLRAKPSFEPAVAAEGRLLLRPETNFAGPALEFLQILSDSRQTVRLGRYSRLFLDRWANDKAAHGILRARLSYYIAVEMEPPGFNAEWGALSRAIERSPDLRQSGNELRNAFLSESLPVDASMRSFQSWTRGDDVAVFSRLLKCIGDYYLRTGSARNALGRYAGAWFMDKQNPEYALDVATVLREHRELDSDRQLFKQMVNDLFSIKGESYRKGDWLSILRLHIILGTIFEKDGKWGPPDDPESAYWHWSHAATAEVEILNQNPKTPPSPGVHEHLAIAIQHIGLSKALRTGFDEFLKAATGFVAVGDSKSAREAWLAAKNIAATAHLSADAESQLHRINSLISAMQ